MSYKIWQIRDNDATSCQNLVTYDQNRLNIARYRSMWSQNSNFDITNHTLCKEILNLPTLYTSQLKNKKFHVLQLVDLHHWVFLLILQLLQLF